MICLKKIKRLGRSYYFNAFTYPPRKFQKVHSRALSSYILKVSKSLLYHNIKMKRQTYGLRTDYAEALPIEEESTL